jgi:SnoaL-like domain
VFWFSSVDPPAAAGAVDYVVGKPITRRVIDRTAGRCQAAASKFTDLRRQHMPTIETVVEDYIAMWNEADPQRRRELVSHVLSDDATYLDPLMSGQGPDQIDALIAGAQQQFPGHRFALVAGPDSHHDQVRFTWSLTINGSEPVAVGIDFATIAADGRLHSVTGFLEDSQAA